MSLTGTVNDATATNSPCGFSETNCGSSSNNSSTHICINCDFSYDDSLLSHESEDSEWISDSKSNHGLSSENPLTPLSTNGIIQCVRSEYNISVEHLLEIEDIQEFSTDGPLFWPYEGKFSWSFEESGSPFCISPRGGLVFGSRSMTPRIKESSEKGHESICRVSCAQKMNGEIVTPPELNDEKVAFKGTKDDNKVLCVDKTLVNEDHESDYYDLLLVRKDFCLDEEEPEISIETLVGLKEFDGREGLDSEFNGDVFMLEEA
ncbi:hypothetical protein DEO72_LG3g2994 [Vigna unguiculata]|uniref:Uncharacterized protein n=1 Tax=Vigna unguiculata TaxID=3917 RepID=A0A4D6LJD5_VIGUN|nr:hypothetical protein DEO72_LG3g2994 [Vigna unguiculata]